MNFHTRKWVKPEDLNPNGTLFGGSLLRWIDEEAAIYAICQLDNQRVVTKLISEVNFVSSARQGDIIELGMKATHFGRTSITLRCEVRNKVTRKSILTIEKMVFVNLGADGKPAPHGREQIRYADEAYERYRQTVQNAADATALAAANEAARVERRLGIAKGAFEVSDDIDAHNDDVSALFDRRLVSASLSETPR